MPTKKVAPNGAFWDVADYIGPVTQPDTMHVPQLSTKSLGTEFTQTLHGTASSHSRHLSRDPGRRPPNGASRVIQSINLQSPSSSTPIPDAFTDYDMLYRSSQNGRGNGLNITTIKQPMHAPPLSSSLVVRDIVPDSVTNNIHSPRIDSRQTLPSFGRLRSILNSTTRREHSTAEEDHVGLDSLTEPFELIDVSDGERTEDLSPAEGMTPRPMVCRAKALYKCTLYPSNVNYV